MIGDPRERDIRFTFKHDRGPGRIQPISGWYTRRHMIATMTGGVAQGTRASVRASQRKRSGCSSRSARPSPSAY